MLLAVWVICSFFRTPSQEMIIKRGHTLIIAVFTVFCERQPEQTEKQY